MAGLLQLAGCSCLPARQPSAQPGGALTCSTWRSRPSRGTLCCSYSHCSDTASSRPASRPAGRSTAQSSAAARASRRPRSSATASGPKRSPPCWVPPSPAIAALQPSTTAAASPATSIPSRAGALMGPEKARPWRRRSSSSSRAGRSAASSSAAAGGGCKRSGEAQQRGGGPPPLPQRAARTLVKSHVAVANRGQQTHQEHLQARHLIQRARRGPAVQEPQPPGRGRGGDALLPPRRLLRLNLLGRRL